jgi:membrane-bound lytic murein transglycosylase MltF
MRSTKFKIQATLFVSILFITTLLTGIAAGIAVGKNVAEKYIKVQRQYYEQELRLKDLKLKQVKEVLKTMIDYECSNLLIFEAIMETFNPELIAKVIAAESEYKIDAISPKGCRGLMQLTPDKLDDWKNPRKNILVGARYLKEQLDYFGDLELALAAYNAGPGMVIKSGNQVPEITETQGYVKKILGLGAEVEL